MALNAAIGLGRVLASWWLLCSAGIAGFIAEFAERQRKRREGEETRGHPK